MSKATSRRRYVSLLLDMTDPHGSPTVHGPDDPSSDQAVAVEASRDRTSSAVAGADDPWLQRAGLDDASLAKIARIRRLAKVLDSQFTVPGTSRTFGIDAVLGLIPGIGGSAGLVLSVVLIVEAIRAGARVPTVARMLGVAGLDAALGAIPVLGGLTDFVLKANERNVRTLASATLQPERTDAESRRIVVGTVIGAMVLVGLVLVVAVIGVAALLRAIF